MAEPRLDEHQIGKTLIDKTWIRDRAQRSADQAGIYTLSAPAALGRGGQETLAFRPDGSFSMTGPGPDDRTGARTGTWKIDGDRVVLGFDGNDARATVQLSGDGAIAVRSNE